MPTKCAVTGCPNYHTKGTQIKFFTFPKTEVLQSEWLKACGLREDVDCSKRRICSEHFDASSFTDELHEHSSKRGIRFLKDDAIPTLYIFDRTYEIANEPQTIHIKIENPLPERSEFEAITVCESCGSIKNLKVEQEVGQMQKIIADLQARNINLMVQNEKLLENEKELTQQIEFLDNAVSALTKENLDLQIQNNIANNFH